MGDNKAIISDDKEKKGKKHDDEGMGIVMIQKKIYSSLNHIFCCLITKDAGDFRCSNGH